jgi:hypothetical protein
LNRETRGLISEIINNLYEEQSVLEMVNWVLETDARAKVEAETFALGYVLGSLMNHAYGVARHEKRDKKTNESWMKYAVKKFGEEEATRIIEEFDRRVKEQVKELKAKGGRPINVEPTDKETDAIRNMLIPMIPQFREKISKELALRKV